MGRTPSGGRIAADVLIPENIENHGRVIAALSELDDHAAAELTPRDFTENVAVKIADVIEVDGSIRAWTISYVDAAPYALETNIGDTTVPYVDLATLIKSKETYREQDRVDVERLRAIQQERQK